MSFFTEVLTSSFGAVLIGVLISVQLWGISCAQAWHYFQTYPQDSFGLKLLVAVVFACDTLHQCVISHAIYTYVVSHYNDPIFILQEAVWSILLQIPLQGVVSLLVQTFFAYRIFKLSGRSYLLFSLVMALALAEAAALTGVTVQVYRTPGNWVIRAQKIRVLEPVACALACAADLLIAGVLIVLLGRGKSHFHQTNSVIAKLMAVILSTGLLTTCCAIIILITYFVMPNTLVYVSCYFVIGRLYTNSFLVQLNMRYTMRQQLSATRTTFMTSVPLPYSFADPAQPYTQSDSPLHSSWNPVADSTPHANTYSASYSGSHMYSPSHAHPV